ncbi:MAG: hypothetical protein HY785_11070 [Oscillatoriophycideae cyanobacterium NC_groundwater_1537_Pr4_S-0.65um_50_18]|nr:hypothetical protein [Oscillatoriophycideae cyanobacterium NC_groundwater_1537_Pr4_S-0.65um_50_18]
MIIADTGFFVALGNRADQNHSAAIQILSGLRETLITAYPVITETCYLLARDSGINAQCAFLDDHQRFDRATGSQTSQLPLQMLPFSRKN